MAKMLLEIKFYYDDGHVSHDLIECENPTKWEGNTVLTNMAKRAKFQTNAFKHKIVKIEKKCVLACKTKKSNNMDGVPVMVMFGLPNGGKCETKYF